MTKLSKRAKLMQDFSIKDEVHTLENAIEKIVTKYGKTCPAKFDETFEIAIKTGINTQKNETIKGSIILPHGNGKVVKILAFVDGEDAVTAASLGATVVTSEEIKSKVKAEFVTGFDSCITTPSIMPKLSAVAKVLGPRGLMPNIKLGTVDANIAKLINEINGGRVEFRSDKQGNVNLAIGKISFEKSKLKENIESLLQAIKAAKPITTKGLYIKNISLSSTMGIGVKLSLEGLN